VSTDLPTSEPQPWIINAGMPLSCGVGSRDQRNAGDGLEHFQEKWNPVFRPKMRPLKMLERFSFPLKREPL
jgi:hypothetical protein